MRTPTIRNGIWKLGTQALESPVTRTDKRVRARDCPIQGLVFRACLQIVTYYHNPQKHFLTAVAMMPQSSSTASYSSTLQTIFLVSLKEYEEKTKKNLITHPLMAQLQTCDSPTDILAVLRNQVQQFEQSTTGDDKLTKRLNPTVNVLYTFSSAIGAGLGLVNFI
jgi:hypothetical protein